jgi:hypothetical protein
MDNHDSGGGGNDGGGHGGGGSGSGTDSGTGDGGGGTVTPDWVSGSRLRARVQTSPDGAKAMIGWYDSQLRINCAAQTAADGQTRCLPLTSISVGSFFSDTGCTASLGQLPKSFNGACAATLAQFYDPVLVCGDYGYPTYKMHFYPVDGVFTDTVFSRSGSSCIPNTDKTKFPYDTYTFYQLGAEVAPSTYVAFTSSTE